MTYNAYLEYAQRISVKPYTRKAWDAMSPMQKALIARLAK